MSPRQTPAEPARPAMGLSFAFPMRLPENGTGAGGQSKTEPAKSPTGPAAPKRAEAS